MRAPVAAKLGAIAFNCPNPKCGAFAHHRWFETLGFPKIAGQLQSDMEARKHQVAQHHEAIASVLADQFLSVSELNLPQVAVSNVALRGLFVSLCAACGKFALWVNESLVFPHSVAAQPHGEMPMDVQVDFIEAASIANKSPRGAAGLLRLCIQKLINGLVPGSDDLNKKIGSLVERGLDRRIQQSLDTVRVIGNEAVHPGDLTYFESPETVNILFTLVNLIVDSQIAQPKAIDALYQTLPAEKLEGIEKRDTRRTPNGG